MDALIALWFAAFVRIRGGVDKTINKKKDRGSLGVLEFGDLFYSFGAVLLVISNILKKLMNLEKIICKNGLKNRSNLLTARLKRR